MPYVDELGQWKRGKLAVDTDGTIIVITSGGVSEHYDQLRGTIIGGPRSGMTHKIRMSTAQHPAALPVLRTLLNAARDSATCDHCGRFIIRKNGRWIDPEATGDDSIWAETCDAHDTFEAEHQP